jgi:tRNA threonylcarbamoyl adenosine modification protein YjeE
VSPEALVHPGLTQEELEAWGRLVGAALGAPAFLALSGDLGAGKSVLARALARGAGVAGAVPSPTYNLLFRHPAARGRVIVHVDLYRLRSPEELGELGWDELPGSDEIVVVEWPERAGARLPAPRWDLRLERVRGAPGLRRLGAEPVGDAPPLPPPPSSVSVAVTP